MTTVPQPDDPANSYTCAYDAWNRLVEVKDGARVHARYEYDGLSRRVKAHVDSDSSGGPDTWVHFYYTNDWRLLETRSTTAAENTAPETLQPGRQYVWSVRYTDALVRRDTNTDTDDLCDDETLYALGDASDGRQAGKAVRPARSGAPGVTRTPDLRFRKPPLCPAELRAQARCGDRFVGIRVRRLPAPHRSPPAQELVSHQHAWVKRICKALLQRRLRCPRPGRGNERCSCERAQLLTDEARVGCGTWAETCAAIGHPGPSGHRAGPRPPDTPYGRRAPVRAP